MAKRWQSVARMAESQQEVDTAAGLLCDRCANQLQHKAPHACSMINNRNIYASASLLCARRSRRGGIVNSACSDGGSWVWHAGGCPGSRAPHRTAPIHHCGLPSTPGPPPPPRARAA